MGTLIGSLNVDRIGKDMPKAEMKAYDNDVDAPMALTSGQNRRCSDGWFFVFADGWRLS